LAFEEAVSFGHNYIGTEHLLLGLLQEERGLAGEVLRNLGLSADPVRAKLRQFLAGGGAASA
jgi:ATP-dependent Clp protease ATP-binding subunit ClpC